MGFTRGDRVTDRKGWGGHPGTVTGTRPADGGQGDTVFVQWDGIDVEDELRPDQVEPIAPRGMA